MRKIEITFVFFMTITLLACGGTNSEMPSLPREEPDPSYDRVVRSLITEYSTNLELNPRNIKTWKEYGDVCYMNGWYEEAATAYKYAASNGLPQCKMRLAYCERELGDVNACITASNYLKRAMDPEAAITLAAWHLEDGDLDSTSKWIKESGLGYSERRSIVEVRMYLQRGEGQKARQALEPLLQKRPRPIVLQLIQEVGRFNQDEALINGYPSPSYFEKTLPDEPFILAISGLARTPEADIKRASWIRRNQSDLEGPSRRPNFGHHDGRDSAEPWCTETRQNGVGFHSRSRTENAGVLVHRLGRPSRSVDGSR